MEITRYYFALTNFCNRSCELCSCHSDPTRTTNLTFDKFIEIVQSNKEYEAQLEGGEPTIHPDFFKMVDYLVKDPLCKKIILCTNAVTMPIVKKSGVLYEEESIDKMKEWLIQFIKKPFVLKPSVNSHLINHSSVHMEKMVIIKKSFESLNFLEGSQLVYNVRRIPKPMTEDGEIWITENLKKLDLYHLCNDFEYQRYGKAKNEEDLSVPFIISNPVKFFLIAPDGKNFGTDLIERANYMEDMK
jgi:hypothetical protein